MNYEDELEDLYNPYLPGEFRYKDGYGHWNVSERTVLNIMKLKLKLLAELIAHCDFYETKKPVELFMAIYEWVAENDH